MKRVIGLLLLIPMLFLGAHAENGAELSFSSFEGGGAEYWIEIEDLSIVIYEAEKVYDSDNEPLPPGSGYTMTFTFKGLNPGTTTVTVHASSALMGNSSAVYTAVVDEALHVTLNREESATASIAGTYKFEGEGFGGDFTITLNADGTYEFYEGPLSSYMGMGTWNACDDVIHMTEGNAGFALSFTFGVEDNVLIYLSAESDAFPYVALSDGARFIRSNDVNSLEIRQVNEPKGEDEIGEH